MDSNRIVTSSSPYMLRITGLCTAELSIVETKAHKHHYYLEQSLEHHFNLAMWRTRLGTGQRTSRNSTSQASKKFIQRFQLQWNPKSKTGKLCHAYYGFIMDISAQLWSGSSQGWWSDESQKMNKHTLFHKADHTMFRTRPLTAFVVNILNLDISVYI